MLNRFLLSRVPRHSYLNTYIHVLPIDLYCELVKFILSEPITGNTPRYRINNNANRTILIMCYSSGSFMYDFHWGKITDTPLWYRRKIFDVEYCKCPNLISVELLDAIINNEQYYCEHGEYYFKYTYDELNVGLLF